MDTQLGPFRSTFGQDIFRQKYQHEGAETWEQLARTLVDDVCGGLLPKDECDQLVQYISLMYFIPGGRYLYYAGRPNKFWNNCFLLKAEEDTREDWANLSWKSESALLTGGGIGVDYSVYRPSGAPIARTGGIASGPIPKMQMINEIGRRVMQGGSRRSAIYASLRHSHTDVQDFLRVKDWHNLPLGNTGLTYWDIKQQDFNFTAPLDMTNVSVNYDTAWLMAYLRTGTFGDVFRTNVSQALRSGEPGFSFNFFEHENETLRNAPVSGSTVVLTSEGYREVSSIVDSPVSLWTGKQYAPNVVFRKTKEDALTVNVHTISGNTITTDPEHEFFVLIPRTSSAPQGSFKPRKKPAESLQPGDKLMVSYPNQEDFDWEVVSRITLGEVQDVFCCDVQKDEHSFMANGVIVSNCTEVTSEDDSDVCNLGSLNFGRIPSIDVLKDVARLATKFLLCGTLRADVPYTKVSDVRSKNRRLGLGLMGVHEWIIKRGQSYSVTPELHSWLKVYKGESDRTSRLEADRLGISRPVANRAIAPTGSIGILAGTSTGIEPLFAVAYKRRYLKGNEWMYQYVVDSAAQEVVDLTGVDPDTIESSIDLASDPERRIKFQADVQDYVDMAISSTINLPAFGTEWNNEDTIEPFARMLAKYAPRLRGFTCYPDGARGGQPLTSVPYREAVSQLGEVFQESHDVCDITGKGGSCGV